MAAWNAIDGVRSGLPFGLVLVLATSCLLPAGCADPVRTPRPQTHAAATQTAEPAVPADRDGPEELHLFPSAPHRQRSSATGALPLQSWQVANGRRPPAPGATSGQTGPNPLPSPPGGLPVVVRPPRSFRVSDVERLPTGTPRLLEATHTRPLVVAATAPPKRGTTSHDRIPGGPPDDGDRARREIAAMLHDYLATFNRHDAVALAGHWSDAAESIDLASGESTHGRGAVEEVFSALFQADAEATIDLDVESIRLVGRDVAVVDVLSHITFSPDAARSGARSRLSAVVSRHDGPWLIESVRESPLAPEAPSERLLDSLDWLIGEWEDAGDGVTAHTRCFWSTGRAFLIRCHTVSYDPAGEAPAAAVAGTIPDLLPPGSGSREITEIIGWDSRRSTIRSWVYTSEGRFAEGTWTRRGDRWLVRMEGCGADDGATCIATLERIGTDELALRCTGDSLADALPPSCDFRRTDR